MKIVLINHSYQVRYFYRRWQLLAHTHPDLDVTLLAPTEYEGTKIKITHMMEGRNSTPK